MSVYGEKFEKEMGALKNTATEEINKFRTDGAELLKIYTEKLAEIENKFTNLSNYEAKSKETLDKILQANQETKALLDEIKKIKNDILVDPSDNEYSIFNGIKASQNKITEIYNEVTNYNKLLFGYIKKNITPITQQEYNKIQSPEDKETKDGKFFKITYETVQGEKGKVDELLSSYKQFMETDEQNIVTREHETKQKIDILLKKIEDLLPGATAAGLSESYSKAEKSAKRGILLWIVCFVVSICASLAVGWWLFDKGIIIFNAETSLIGSIIQVLRVACFEFPLIWLAWTANIKISQYIRLTEEYRHKWTMMRIFDGMRAILNENDGDNATNNKEAFYHALLTSFAENPSKSLDKKYEVESPLNTFTKFLPHKKENSDGQADDSNKN